MLNWKRRRSKIWPGQRWPNARLCPPAAAGCWIGFGECGHRRRKTRNGVLDVFECRDVLVFITTKKHSPEMEKKEKSKIDDRLRGES